MSAEKWSPCNKKVECCMCKRKYTCIPMDDYFNSTNPTDGLCLKCLKKQGHAQKVIITPHQLPELN